MIRKNLYLLLSVLLFTTSCSTFNSGNSLLFADEEFSESAGIREKLVSGALKLIGARELNVNGKKFLLDCTGTILAVYYYAGIDLTLSFNLYSGNGVSRIYHYLEDKSFLYKTEYPVPGDIIFWDNTYDKNNDNVVNDYLTHIGMVVTVSENGAIEYIHYHYTKGIILEKMNLLHPDTYSALNDGEKNIINSAMRMKGSSETDKWLSSQLYRNFGKGYLLVQ